MNENKRKKTTFDSSVGADERQSIQNNCTNIIAENSENINTFDDFHYTRTKFLDSSYLKTVSMEELYETVYGAKPPIIDGFLYPGTYIFAGTPKIGKSFFMAQLAYHISTGKSLWDYKVRKGTVLYLALEDDYRRLQSRMYRMFGEEATDNLLFSVSAGKLGDGLEDQINRFMTDHPDTNLIIIDTLQRVRTNEGEAISYAGDYDVIGKLKDISYKYGICLLIVHHTRKQEAKDIMESISGTNGLLGGADGAFVLYKKIRTSNNAVLEISGRDQPDQKLYLNRNTETLVWELEKAETELWKEPPEPILLDIVKLVDEQHPVWSGSPTELTQKLNIDIKPNKLALKLNVNAARLLNDYSIRYTNIRNHDGRKITLVLEK